MRITIQLLPLFILALTLPLSLVYQLNFLEVLFISLSIMVLRTILVFHRLGDRGKDKRIILETMSVSHYNEKIRWCLDYLEIPYIEEEDAGILGLFLLGRTVPLLKIPGRAISIGNTPDILRYFYGEYCCEKERADFLQPTREGLELEKKFDKLGHNYRAFAYFEIFNSSIVDSWEKEVWGLYQPGVPQWQKAILKFVSPVFRKLVSTKLNITSENAIKSLKEARKTIDEVDKLLSNGRKTIMGTPEPTYLDFHFSSMVAIMLRPPMYGGGVLTKQTWDPDQKGMPQRLQEEKEYLLQTTAGRLAMDMYSNYRHKKVFDSRR